jgi:predicted O-methyltransferase YrrM
VTPAQAITRYVELHGLSQWEMSEVLHDVLRIEVETVLEIGTYRGDSLRIWRAAWPDAQLIGVEPTDELSPAVDELQVDWVKGASQDGAVFREVVVRLEGTAVDFLYIDGDHHYAAVRRDWELYEPLVRPGGIIVLHDAVITWNKTVDVHLLYEEIRNGRRTKLLYDGLDPANPYGGGTGAALIFK